LCFCGLPKLRIGGLQQESPAVRATGLVTKTSRKETVLPVGAGRQAVTGTSPKESPDRSRGKCKRGTVYEK
jgi:hypothetical protein